jgi:hypothetical protein
MLGKIRCARLDYSHVGKMNTRKVLLTFSPTSASRNVSLSRLSLSLSVIQAAVAQKRQLRQGSNQKVAAPRTKRAREQKSAQWIWAQSSIIPLLLNWETNPPPPREYVSVICNPLVRAVEPSAYICKLFLLHTAEQHQRRD